MRQSNIELLRIICMFFIVLEHILIMGTDFFANPVGNQLVVANTIIGFTYVGVNCFILITGYFGADFSWKRLLSIYLTCLFYELAGFLIACGLGDVEWSMTVLSYILFPLSHSNIWFIRCYVILLLLLPILNSGLERLDKKQYLLVLLLLTILNLYFGWFHMQPNFNGDGYNASQMVYLYAIGRYLYRYVNWEQIRAYKNLFLVGWVIMAIIWGMAQNVSELVYEIPHWNGWAYNNPIVLIAAIVFFAYFRCIEIPQSKAVNILASTMVAVLVIHMNRYLGSYIFDGVREVIYMPVVANSLWLQVLALILLAVVGVMVLAMCDLPRLTVHKWLLNRELVHTHTHTMAPMSIECERYGLYLIYV